MAGFAAVTVEVAFDAGFRTPIADATWTDVSGYVEGDVQIDWGRSNELSQTSPSTCTVVLDNSDGRFTAGLSTSPYYPNVKLDRMLRVTVTPEGGTPSVRFTGYIDAWPTAWPGQTANYATATISAVSRLGRLGFRNALFSILVQSAVSNGATDVFPLDEPPDSKLATSETSASTMRVAGAGKRLRFTDDHATFARGQYLLGSGDPVDLSNDTTLALSFRWSVYQDDAQLFGPFRVDDFSNTNWRATTDGDWHRAFWSYDAGTELATLYIDSQEVEAQGVMPNTYAAKLGVKFAGSLADVCRFDGTALDAAAANADFLAFRGGFGSSTDAVLELFAGFGDIPPTEVDADAGATTMGGVDTSGLSLVEAFRVVESTEGGVLVDARNGDLRLIGRRARYGSSVVATLDMAEQHIGPDFSPILDRSSLRNLVVGTNAASNLLGVDIAAVSSEARDQTSIDEYGEFGSSVEVNAESPNEAHTAASWMVANHAEPRPRVPSLSFTPLLFDATDANDLLAVFLGDRVEAVNLPDQASDSSLELFVEGGSEVWGPVSGWITWSVSPVGLEDSIFLIDTDAIDDPTKYIGY